MKSDRTEDLDALPAHNAHFAGRNAKSSGRKLRCRMGEKLGITRKARRENLPDLIEFLEEACRRTGADRSICFDLRLAVEEVCTNLIQHGNADMEPGPIKLNFQANPERIVISIRALGLSFPPEHSPPSLLSFTRQASGDLGLAFPPEHAPPPDLESGWEDRPLGGLGWHLVFELKDEVIYRSDGPQGNHLTLIKRLDSIEEPLNQED